MAKVQTSEAKGKIDREGPQYAWGEWQPCVGAETWEVGLGREEGDSLSGQGVQEQHEWPKAWLGLIL